MPEKVEATRVGTRPERESYTLIGGNRKATPDPGNPVRIDNALAPP